MAQSNLIIIYLVQLDGALDTTPILRLRPHKTQFSMSHNSLAKSRYSIKFYLA